MVGMCIRAIPVFRGCIEQNLYTVQPVPCAVKDLVSIGAARVAGEGEDKTSGGALCDLVEGGEGSQVADRGRLEPDKQPVRDRRDLNKASFFYGMGYDIQTGIGGA